MATELDYAPSAPFFHDPFQQDSDYGDFAQWPAMHYDSFDHAQSCLNPSALLQHSASFDQFSTDAGFSFDGSSLPYGADISQDSIKPSALWQQEQCQDRPPQLTFVDADEHEYTTLPPPSLPRRVSDSDVTMHTPHRPAPSRTSTAIATLSSADRSRKSRRTAKLSDLDRKHLCEYHLKHPHTKQEIIGEMYGVERSTVSKIIKAQARWLAIPEPEEVSSPPRKLSAPELGQRSYTSSLASADMQTSPSIMPAPARPGGLHELRLANSDSGVHSAPSMSSTPSGLAGPILAMQLSSSSSGSSKPSPFAEMEDELGQWIEQELEYGADLSDAAILDKARELAPRYKSSPHAFRGSHNWLVAFKERAGLARDGLTGNALVGAFNMSPTSSREKRRRNDDDDGTDSRSEDDSGDNNTSPSLSRRSSATSLSSTRSRRPSLRSSRSGGLLSRRQSISGHGLKIETPYSKGSSRATSPAPLSTSTISLESSRTPTATAFPSTAIAAPKQFTFAQQLEQQCSSPLRHQGGLGLGMPAHIGRAHDESPKQAPVARRASLDLFMSSPGSSARKAACSTPRSVRSSADTPPGNPFAHHRTVSSASSASSIFTFSPTSASSFGTPLSSIAGGSPAHKRSLSRDVPNAADVRESGRGPLSSAVNSMDDVLAYVSSQGARRFSLQPREVILLNEIRQKLSQALLRDDDDDDDECMHRNTGLSSASASSRGAFSPIAEVATPPPPPSTACFA